MAYDEFPDEPEVKMSPLKKALMKVTRSTRWRWGKYTIATRPNRQQDANLRTATSSGLMSQVQNFTQLSYDRLMRYSDYDAMDDGSPEIARALSLYASEATVEDNKKHQVVWCEAKKKPAAEAANKVIERLSLGDQAWGICRNIAKYGDSFILHLFDKADDNKFYLKKAQYVYPARVERIESDELEGFRAPDLEQIVPSENQDSLYRPWEITHARIMGYDRETIYGRSMIEEVRRIWKLLSILETMTALAHVQRAVERNIFYIDVGNASEDEALAHVKRVKNWLRRKEYFDPATNQFKPDFNPVAMQEDIFWPTRPGSESKVETLSGKQIPPGLVEDIEYFRNKLCAGIGVPRDYLDGTTSTTWNAKAALVMQDIHFARHVSRLQKVFKRTVKRIIDVALTVELGNAADLDYTVHMCSMNMIEDALKEDLWERKATLATSITSMADTMQLDKQLWVAWIFKNFFPEIPEDFVEQLLMPVPMDDGSGGGEGDGEDGEKSTKDRMVKTPTSMPKLPQMAPLGGKDSSNGVDKLLSAIIGTDTDLKGLAEALTSRKPRVKTAELYKLGDIPREKREEKVTEAKEDDDE